MLNIINIIFIDSSYTESLSTFCLSYGDYYFLIGSIFYEYISILSSSLYTPLTDRNNRPIEIEYYHE
jgi:hypothetical protein